MSLSLENYDRLGEHLSAIDQRLAEFSEANGYKLHPPLHGGRYPNRRLSRDGDVIRTIHISMADQPSGERFRTFFPDIPYTIFGGATIDDLTHNVRWHSPFLHTRNIPFSTLVVALPLYLSHFHSFLSGFTLEEVRSYQCSSPLALASGA